MCGRIVWVWDPATGQLLRKYDDGYPDRKEIVHVVEKNRYNVPPASHLPVIAGREAEAGGAAHIEIVRWGFPVPKRPNGVFNTRIETAYESPMWKGLVGQHHCLFPVKGFYEWDRTGKRKVPYFIHRVDDRPMLLAGLVGRRRWKDDELLCGSVVTCRPNDLVGRLHDRMPVIMEEAAADDWLHPRAAGHDRILDLAVPATDGVLAMHEVTSDVNSTDNDRPDLIRPVGGTQARLG